MKKIIFILLLVFPIIIYGECNLSLQKEGQTLAENITDEVIYNKSSEKFSYVLYNLSDGMRVKYNDKDYVPKNNEVTLTNIVGGSNVTVYVYYKDNCGSAVSIIKKHIPYYNKYYNGALCNSFENADKLYVCTSKFTSYYVSEEIVKLAIENYNDKRIPIEEEEEIVVEETVSIIEKTLNFINNWGIKIALVLCSSLISIMIGRHKYIKELHGF